MDFLKRASTPYDWKPCMKISKPRLSIYLENQWPVIGGYFVSISAALIRADWRPFQNCAAGALHPIKAALDAGAEVEQDLWRMGQVFDEPM